ncbi:response regulator transcription factor [Clostridium botulinum]|uniref:Stage 0 sporulation protein A homolog n=1 Tax=Clostridium botulinum C/D str. DC5 TaxID=1443128 RepID=A0A0A0I5U4_CLOBO|nr:response regulator transcription factor [Clostridium botulinum]KEI01908.1 PhoP family transcriptional regulator [Clostridium botulinum C/D str. BKT75002]KEI10010.1 PhoP family transcriptional regulator [Clostridium botulinum C/D str. BKT2873]KGM96003.1 PhoP family transcriptional regulator [Clostridium botulinum C/D str. DC5]KGM98235.1 PhoP family transcriptional regulator [Clostridium botulinum D str. CCUG 7971]KOC50444.1 PhoP family transcriptional regulator [Clostridium botulinum]
MAKILIADDEEEIIELLSLYLEKDNNIIYGAKNGLDAFEIIEDNNVDLAIIDIMMPKIDGYHLVKKIREKYEIPVIMLSAKSEYSDKILGLELGADDYITKPFNAMEVVARVKAQLRRYYKYHSIGDIVENNNEKCLEYGSLKLNNSTCTLYKDGVEIPLTSTEYKIIFYLMNSCGRVFTKKQIFEYVWDEPFYGDDNAIMVHISNLRDKIENDSKNPEYIKTIRGLGYKFNFNTI